MEYKTLDMPAYGLVRFWKNKMISKIRGSFIDGQNLYGLNGLLLDLMSQTITQQEYL